MAKETVKEPVLPLAVQNVVDAIGIDRKAKGAAQASTKERNNATRGVFLSAVDAFAKEAGFDADTMIRLYYEKQPTKTTLYNRRNEWNDIRNAAKTNATKTALLWPSQDDSEKAEVRNITKQMFLDGVKLLNAAPLREVSDILTEVRTVKSKDTNAGDVLAILDKAIVDLNARFMGDYAPYHEQLNTFRMAYHAARAKGAHRTTEELEAEAEKAAAAPVVAPLKVAA